MTSSNDDGFREIQLNGKQLVFLFMAVTVVLVVTFLTGVLVGRGVRAERAEAAQAEVLSEAPVTPSHQQVDAAPEGDPTKASPPPGDAEGGVDAKTSESLEPAPAIVRNRPTPPASTPELKPVDTAKAAPSKPADTSKTPAPQAMSAPPKVQAQAAPAAAASDAASKPPQRNGYAVQVAAVNGRGEADSIVKRLTTKGYSAYIEEPKGNQKMFRVRVGTFTTRREAVTTANKLKKEEKFNPWVTR